MPNQVIGHVSFFSGSGLSGASSIATSGNFSKPHTCTLASYLTPDFIFILLLFSFGLDFPTMFILSYCAVYILKAPSNPFAKRSVICKWTCQWTQATCLNSPCTCLLNQFLSSQLLIMSFLICLCTALPQSQCSALFQFWSFLP